MASKKVNKSELNTLVNELINECIQELSERSLTPAEEKKKEEIVKALKPKYGKSDKTYAIATSQAKKLAEDLENPKREHDVFPPNFGINGSNQWLAIVYKNGIVDESQYFDNEYLAKEWVENFDTLQAILETEESKSPKRTIKILNWKELKEQMGLEQAKIVSQRLKDDYLKNGLEETKAINYDYAPGFFCLFNHVPEDSDNIVYVFTGTAG